jgi:hypothetical protein
MKELEDENRHLRKMYQQDTLKAEIANQSPAKKERGRLADARWPKRLCTSMGLPYGWPVPCSPSASPATNKTLRTAS